MPTYQLSFTYATNSTSIHMSMTEEIRHWLNCFDQPQIRKPYLPSQISKHESFYKNSIRLNPFLGNKFKVGGDKI